MHSVIKPRLLLVMTAVLCAALATLAASHSPADSVELANNPLNIEPIEYSQDNEGHCVATVSDMDSLGIAPLEMTCYSTFREAIYVATNGPVANAPEDASEVATDPFWEARIFTLPGQSTQSYMTTSDSSSTTSSAVETQSTANAETTTVPERTTGEREIATGDGYAPTQSRGTGTVMSIEYVHSEFRGNTLTFRHGSGCDRSDDKDHQVANIGYHWNDEISSFTASSPCAVRHFQNDNFRGSSTALQTRDNNMGVFNDETTSIRWY